MLLTAKAGPASFTSKRALFSILAMESGSKRSKAAILATFSDSDRTGPEGRLGPPESDEMARMSQKCPKGHFWPFLRGTRATSEVVVL